MVLLKISEWNYPGSVAAERNNCVTTFHPGGGGETFPALLLPSAAQLSKHDENQREVNLMENFFPYSSFSYALQLRKALSQLQRLTATATAAAGAGGNGTEAGGRGEPTNFISSSLPSCAPIS